MAASSVTRIQLLVTSSVNPAKTGSCVGGIRVCVCVCVCVCVLGVVRRH